MDSLANNTRACLQWERGMDKCWRAQPFSRPNPGARSLVVVSPRDRTPSPHLPCYHLPFWKLKKKVYLQKNTYRTRSCVLLIESPVCFGTWGQPWERQATWCGTGKSMPYGIRPSWTGFPSLLTSSSVLGASVRATHYFWGCFPCCMNPYLGKLLATWMISININVSSFWPLLSSHFHLRPPCTHIAVAICYCARNGSVQIC